MGNLRMLALALIVFCFLPTPANADAARDKRALIEFKKSITADPLSVLADWDESSSSACNWTGVTCSKRHPGRVVRISLENSTLRGSISPHISNLSFLQVLDLYNNSFSGHIPCSLGKLHRLKLLDLCANEIEGSIPHQLGNLSSLTLVYLCYNSLSGLIPSSVKKLGRVRKLDLYENQLRGEIPPFLGELRSLEELDLSENNIHGSFPLSLTNITSLTFLGLAANRITGPLPVSLGKLIKLKSLYLRQNNFTGKIPGSLANLSSLTGLALGFNSFHGTLPSWIGRLTNLQDLGISSNFFSGEIPELWMNVSKLEMLILSDNSLTGIIPLSFGRLWNLRYLSLSANNFTSAVRSHTLPILVGLSNCSQLQSLNARQNRLTGTLPSSIGMTWPYLEELSLSSNFISGNIPKSFKNSSSLYLLNLSNNMMSGTIPSEIAQMKSLQMLSLGSNKLHGKIPDAIRLLNKSLGYLYLERNSLSGSIPARIGELVNLRELNLHQNRLSGALPSEIGKCNLLEDLQLSANNLSGTIPPEVAGLKSILFNFDLSKNALSGVVPKEIAGLQMAQYINLSSNRLSGNIAHFMDSWLDARDVILSFNSFSGNISKSLGLHLTQLQRIDLSHNNFTGPIPESLSNLSGLQFLDFSYNNFQGEVFCSRAAVKNKTAMSFLNNPLLCGNCFNLSVCSILQHHNTHLRKTLEISIIPSILLGVILLVYLACFCSQTVEVAQNTIVEERFMKLSPASLQRATDDFSVYNLVGTGSQGDVYRGVLSEGQNVAIKVFSTENARKSDKSFRRECQTLGKVRHRNLVKIITVVWSDNLKALVMPFMGNGSLHDLLHRRFHGGVLAPLDLQTRIRLLRELASGLSYLHHDCNPPIIHCDIKPENVLLDDEMTVKLSDFGIARLIGSCKMTPSSSSSVKGSIGYLAPEFGIGGGLSMEADVFGFGVVILETMTRMKPIDDMFDGDLTLSRWVSMAFREESEEERILTLKRILRKADHDGGGINQDNEEDLKMVHNILKVGLLCTSQNAKMRPSMREIESMLVHLGVPANYSRLHDNLDQVIANLEAQASASGCRKSKPQRNYSSSSSC